MILTHLTEHRIFLLDMMLDVIKKHQFKEINKNPIPSSDNLTYLSLAEKSCLNPESPDVKSAYIALTSIVKKFI